MIFYTNKKCPKRAFFYLWCRLSDLNQRPSDYKSDALPAELNRQCETIIYFLFDNFKYKIIIRGKINEKVG